jgi:hypothetical protein
LYLSPIKDPPYWFLQYESLPRYRNWDILTPDLQKETESRGGPVSDFCVKGLLGMAKIALPAIHEATGGDGSGACD